MVSSPFPRLLRKLVRPVLLLAACLLLGACLNPLLNAARLSPEDPARWLIDILLGIQVYSLSVWLDQRFRLRRNTDSLR
ncbi:hypothetical protein [uncultured Aquitalea sp.]|uniref:hypothetical protein n=1 Tax=uncultured Aquitalea sp. TaxID=540272 RepID=UPI0025F09290|nr:hypothetical protein [uncultured Aquitalea sp.]